MSRYRDWPVAFFLTAAIVGSLIFLALFRAGEHARCAHPTGQQKADFCAGLAK